MSLRRAILLAFVIATVAAPAIAQGNSYAGGFQSTAERADERPPELEGVDIVEKLDARLPLDLPFVGDDGKPLVLGDCFDGKHPVILQIGYLKCPMLCNLVLNELVKGLKGVDWNAGEQFKVVSVSVNPLESHQLAAAKKQGYLIEYERAASAQMAAGWRFLTGPESSSRAVADAVGFGYRFVPETGEYAHAAVVILCTPDGRVSRYLYGVKFPPNDLRLGLIEASEGRIGSTLDRFILWCHIYDPDARGYVVFALRLMKLGGLVTLVALFGGISSLWVRDLRRRRLAESALAESAPTNRGAPTSNDLPA